MSSAKPVEVVEVGCVEVRTCRTDVEPVKVVEVVEVVEVLYFVEVQ